MFVNTETEDLEDKRKVLRELFGIEVSYVAWKRATVFQYKFRIYIRNSAISVGLNYSKDSKFSFTTPLDAIEAGVKYAQDYLIQTGNKGWI